MFEGLRREVDEVVFFLVVIMWWLFKVNRFEWGYGFLGCFGLIVLGFMNLVFVLIISNVLYVYYYIDYFKMRKEVVKYVIIFVGLFGVVFVGYFV